MPDKADRRKELKEQLVKEIRSTFDFDETVEFTFLSRNGFFVRVPRGGVITRAQIEGLEKITEVPFMGLKVRENETILMFAGPGLIPEIGAYLEKMGKEEKKDDPSP